ncbi:pseudaminic acid synthase [sulfur-oxidizing endosymbiont of Gigantopelta aegis]|uniref:pseudaminic acid synthase n=1 Tax=sulfur-oxidizing endosymbiont of Gigantopelta aegis TaxID=2794934 RepID=UPI0018DE7255|nr:pseudaminic acid synthase [sulfur-oxidizing endosymbiont of Gigantopelta aegis]
MPNINIAQTEIGEGCSPFIVAELSGNHQQDYSLAEKMLEAAAVAGVHAIKLQTYTSETMTLDLQNKDFVINDEASLWQGESLYSLYAKAATPWEWHQGLFEKARSLGMIAFSSPFDESAVDFLETLNVPCYKIASFENNDLPLIKKVAQTGKPIIVSTGMASVIEIEELLMTIRATGNEQIVLLKCTSNYPADASDSNLATIADMRQRFQCLIGLSDHCSGISVSLAGVALGAVLVEKHFVLDRTAGGIDAAFSLEPDELEKLVHDSVIINRAMGQVQYGGSENEQESKKYRRSIYCSRAIAVGEIISRDNVRVIRPGFGLAPKHFDAIMGKTAKQAIALGDAMRFDLLDGSDE